ncbi:uncharacterized protein TrAtP1_012592 [Trichoderma atroviride]|uniref:uncharacterized protein n=1 Tax=Hypocrea atroviridis TaxID=63577 RepID=UPI003321B2FD|nr:hypothetical protein TrAtP1_012592 [Trichoderma atroviride]
MNEFLVQMSYQSNNLPTNPGGFNPENILHTPAGPSHGRRRMTFDDLAAPFSQEEINSFHARLAETARACINSLGPHPAEMTP